MQMLQENTPCGLRPSLEDVHRNGESRRGLPNIYRHRRFERLVNEKVESGLMGRNRPEFGEGVRAAVGR